MTSSKPYLLRAIYEWLVDNDTTPHLLVDANAAGVKVPESYVKDGSIVLNIAPGAVRNLELGNDYVLFSARFGGVAYDIEIPIQAAKMIYARENGQGLMLAEPGDDGANVDPDRESAVQHHDKPERIAQTGLKTPNLKVIK